MTATLLALAVLANGLGAGVMLSSAMGITPMTMVLPYDRYVETIKFLWPRYDPFMPISNVLTLVLDVVLALVVDGAPARALFVAAAGLQLVVMAVSVVKNVPINRYVTSLDAARQPDDWATADPRTRWRRWNLIRTGIAVLALAVNAVAIAVAHR